jgi:hypothetical protein
MKRLLLFSTLFIISAWNLKAQQGDNQDFSITGFWLFEKADYMEYSPQSQTFLVKHSINDIEGLNAYSYCIQEVVKKAMFYDEVGVVEIEVLFESFLGKYQFIAQPLSSVNKKVLMKFGGIEDMGKESPIQERKFNAPDILYNIEYIDENTIAIIIEKGCTDDNFNITQIAIKCILKREQ